ncbi:MAG TPA: hypothetical protein VKP65_15885, partial [Rhodothermales bacterium]|nr:hypothetical protein [Rhodothermales bacterium]
LGDPNALIRAQHMTDGAPAYSLFARFGDTYARAFLARRDTRLLIVSVEVEGDPHGTHEPENAVVEVQHVGEPVQVDENGFLRSGRRLADVIFDTVDVQVALAGDTLVAAVPDQLYTLDLGLQVQQVWEGAFTPLAMSLDETGAAYLIVHTVSEEDEERYALWVVTPEGERIVDSNVPEPEEDEQAPPIVGYDHHIYLPQGDSLHAFSPDGEHLWAKFGGGLFAGAVATADHRVLVAGGGWLSAFDTSGERTMVFVHDSASWVTPPVLTEHGDILVATEQHLYRLTRKR